jgi:hypothetical protein
VEVVIVAVVIGILVLLAIPLVTRASRPSSPAEQPKDEGRGPVPPAHPDEPLPGSSTRRHRQGKP